MLLLDSFLFLESKKQLQEAAYFKNPSFHFNYSELPPTTKIRW